jgi:hypothetical protein
MALMERSSIGINVPAALTTTRNELLLTFATHKSGRNTAGPEFV